MGKAERKKQEKLERILRTTFTLFTTQGMEKTSISDIATAAGIAKGTFYLYFKDKDDIRDTLVRNMVRQLIANALEGQKESQLPLADKMILVLDRLLNQLQASPLLLRFIHKNVSWSLLRNAMKHAMQDDIDNYMDVFWALAECDSAQWEAPEVMLFTITELVGSTCYSVVVERDPVPLETFKPYLYRTIRTIIESHKIKP